MDKFKNLLNKKKVLVADGGWGTEISKNEDASGQYPELLNLTHPEIIENIARRYINAGADIILTNTFGGNALKLKKYGVEEKIAVINKKGVELSLKFATKETIVFASVGPTGQLLEPYGDLATKDAEECFKQQIEILIDSGADGIVIETMSDIREAICALKAAKSKTDKPVVVSITFNKNPTGYKTIMGTSPEKCAELIEKNQATSAGSNCGFGIEDFVTITKEIRNSTILPIWIKPNAGIPRLISGKTIYPDTPQYMASFIPQLIEAGASIIGGCCGTTPQHILEIAKAVHNYLKKK